MSHAKSRSYSKKFYNVKILKAYVVYLKEQCGWTEERVEQLLELCHIDITFLDSDDHWFDQTLADQFLETVQAMTGDQQIAHKAGQYSFSSYARGIQGRFLQGLASPQFLFRNIGKYSMDYSRGAVIEAIEVGQSQAILRSKVVEGCQEKPYQCQNRRGILEAIPPFFGCVQTDIHESKCVHRGDDCCEYEITWKNVRKFPKPLVAVLVGGLLGLIFFLAFQDTYIAAIVGFNLGLFVYCCLFYRNFKQLQALIGEKDDALREALRLFHRRYEENALKQKIVFNTFHTDSLPGLCSMVAHAIKDSMKYDRVLLMLADKEHNVLRTTSAVGFEGNVKEVVEMAEFNIDPENNTGFFNRVFNTQTPLLSGIRSKK